jgi:undecaprenyl diphosphate synthase
MQKARDSKISFFKANCLEHVAIIMDGNGRWAQKRTHPRVWGHVRGSHVVSQIVRSASYSGVKSLTMYAFSSENWSRPIQEVRILFKLLKKFILVKGQEILDENLRFQVIGDRTAIPKEVFDLIVDLELKSKNNSGMLLNFAFAYGSRQEIINSVNSFISENPGKLISESDFEAHLVNPNPNLDLLIRTGGDQRISNFLLWQAAYAELYFSNTFWPDFTDLEFANILEQINQRHRRFGSIDLPKLEDAKVIAKQNQELLLSVDQLS